MLPNKAYKRNTSTVCLTIAALGCATGAALAFPPFKPPAPQSQEVASRVDRQSHIVEEKLNSWKPDKENDQIPQRALRSPQTDIAGDWRIWSLFDGSALHIKRTGENEYTVDFSTGGCLGGWRLKRTGRYSDGVLILNRPVKEYCPRTYQKLYAVRVEGQEYLVPDAGVEDFQQTLSKYKPDTLQGLPKQEDEDFKVFALGFSVFARKKESPVEASKSKSPKAKPNQKLPKANPV